MNQMERWAAQRATVAIMFRVHATVWKFGAKRTVVVVCGIAGGQARGTDIAGVWGTSGGARQPNEGLCGLQHSGERETVATLTQSSGREGSLFVFPIVVAAEYFGHPVAFVEAMQQTKARWRSWFESGWNGATSGSWVW